MKNITITIIAIAAVFMLSMCNNNEKSKQVAKEKSNNTEVKQENEDACMKPVSPEDSAKFISKQVEVKGDVENLIVLTVDSLKKMNVETIEDFKVICSTGASMKESKTCKGVLLKNILEKAQIKQLNHKDRNFYFVARATDNYKATFSWAEIFNNPTGENVYVLFEENGMPITSQGDMILICKNDIKTGPRHVYWLSSIEVKRID